MSNLLLERDPGTRTGRRRRRRVRRGALALLVAVAVALTSGGLVALLARDPSPDAPVLGKAADGDQLTMLVAMTLAGDASQQADALTIFAVDRTGHRPTVLHIPAGTLGLIPGGGFEPIGRAPIGKALSVGSLSLQQVTIENMLGIAIDRTVGFDDVALAHVVDAIGGIDVEVSERLLEADDRGVRQQVFPLGRRHMGGAEALTYMTYRGEGETELDRFVRAEKVWEAIFARAGRDGGTLERAVRDLGPAVSGPQAAEHLAELLAVFAARERVFEVLPVEPAGSGPDEVYRAVDLRIDTLVTRAFSGSRPPAGVGVGARVQVLNGNGAPEAGRRVAELLVPVGMKIVVTGNAKHFRFTKTRIVVPSDDEESIVLGRKVRELLGVGEVEIGRRGQTVVDVTIVMGRDLLGR